MYNVMYMYMCTAHLLLLQQDEVLSKLKEYARSDPKPDDAPSVELMIAYLEALNGLFEKSTPGQRVTHVALLLCYLEHTIITVHTIVSCFILFYRHGTCSELCGMGFEE